MFDDHYEDDVDAGLDEMGDPITALDHDGSEHDGLTVDLGQLVIPLFGSSANSANSAGGLATYQQKEALRLRNADMARELVQLTGLTHREVNGKLNRSASIAKINDATMAQLQLRLREADAWLRQLTRR